MQPSATKLKSKKKPAESVRDTSENTAPITSNATNGQALLIDQALQVSDIHLSKKNLRTLKHLYPGGEEGEGQSWVSWEDFVRAMAEAGFHISNTDSSAVVFEHRDHSKGRIIFHRPHPEPKLDCIILRVMGKWMAK